MWGFAGPWKYRTSPLPTLHGMKQVMQPSPTQVRERHLHRGARSAPLASARREAVFLSCGCSKKIPHASNTTNLFSHSAGAQNVTTSLTGLQSRSCGAWRRDPSGGARGASLFSPLLLLGPPHSLARGPIPPITPTASFIVTRQPSLLISCLPFPQKDTYCYFGAIWTLQIVSPTQDT